MSSSSIMNSPVELSQRLKSSMVAGLGLAVLQLGKDVGWIKALYQINHHVGQIIPCSSGKLAEATDTDIE